MKVLTKIILFIITIMLVISCDDIFEKDITNDTVQVIYPLNNEQVNSNVVDFQWSNLDGSHNYRLQIFSTNQNKVLDTLTTNTSFSYPLSPGTYQWRVRGENNAYSSSYSFSSTFIVIETSDLTNQQIILTNPSNNIYTNNSTIIFNWQPINSAEFYTFDLVNVTNGNTIVYQLSNITSTSLSLNNMVLVEDAQYLWKVKGTNSTSMTPFSTRTFFLDRTAPNQPTLTLPINEFTQNSSNQLINFSWTIPIDFGNVQSPIIFIIEFSNTINFSSILQSSTVSSNTFQQAFTNSGEYFWRVTAKDSSGNIGISSPTFKFIIN